MIIGSVSKSGGMFLLNIKTGKGLIITSKPIQKHNAVQDIGVYKKLQKDVAEEKYWKPCFAN